MIDLSGKYLIVDGKFIGMVERSNASEDGYLIKPIPDDSGVILLNEEGKAEVTKYLVTLDNEQLKQRLIDYANMPTCLELTKGEILRRGLDASH